MPEGNASYYDKYWQPRDGWSPSAGVISAEERELFARHIRPGKVCLDYGCGDALRYGATLAAEGVDYRGFDVSPTAVAAAREKKVNAEVLAADGRTSLGDGSCDVALCFEVLEHLLEPNVALAEIFRVLKPGGVALLSVPNAAHWTTRAEFLLTGYFNPGGSPHTARVTPWIDPHIRFFNPKLFARMVEMAGFVVSDQVSEPFSLTSMPYLYRKTEWHAVLRALSAPIAFLGTSFPGLFSARLFIEATKPGA
jgi:SAM-dependent methyltransferase